MSFLADSTSSLFFENSETLELITTLETREIAILFFIPYFSISTGITSVSYFFCNLVIVFFIFYCQQPVSKTFLNRDAISSRRVFKPEQFTCEVLKQLLFPVRIFYKLLTFRIH